MNALALQEGRRTWGVWGPLAAAQICQILWVIVRMFASKESDVKVPLTSEVLKGFCLPMFAEAVKADEDEAKAKALLESIKAMDGKSGATVTVTKTQKG